MSDPTAHLTLTVSRVLLGRLSHTDRDALADLVDRAEITIDTHTEKGGRVHHIDPIMKCTELTAADRAVLAKLGIEDVGSKFTFYIKDMELILPKVAGELYRNRHQVHLMLRAIDIKNQIRQGVRDTDLLFDELASIKGRIDELNAAGGGD